MKNIIHYSQYLILLFLAIGFACQQPNKVQPFTVTQTLEQTKQREAAIMGETTLELEDGLSLKLWASDSLTPDIIALEMDDYGRAYLTRAIRPYNSEFDIRGHRDWMTPSISFQSVEDRRAFLRNTFAPEKSSDNEWLADLNGDGSHDWRDLAGLHHLCAFCITICLFHHSSRLAPCVAEINIHIPSIQMEICR